MNRRGPLFLLVIAFGTLAVGLTVLFRLRLAQGDVFPTYSSLRSDPLGTRVLHDSLAALPELRVERQYRPIEEIPTAPSRTILLAGLPMRRWSRITREEFDSIDAAVRSGSRLVVAFRAAAVLTDEEYEKEEKANARELEQREQAGEARVIGLVDPGKRWGADVGMAVAKDEPAMATATEEARALGLAETVTWRSDVHFKLQDDAGWRILYRFGSEPVLIERPLGAGTIVMIADSYFLSNEALQKDRAAALLAWTIGSHARIVFDEAHLGVTTQPGIAALARRYGLSGAFFTLLLLAALFVWRSTALFVPPMPDDADVALTYHPAAGLQALLRRSVPVPELASACVAEWQSTARETDRVRVRAALAAKPADATVVDRYNAAVQALQNRARRASPQLSHEPSDRKT